MVQRSRPEPVTIDETPIECKLRELGPLELRQVRRTDEERLCCGLIEAYHYLGYTQPVGEHLKYLVYAQDLGRPIACFTWSSAPRHLRPRDNHIGWSQATQAAKPSVSRVQLPVSHLAVGARCRTWRRTCWGGWPAR